MERSRHLLEMVLGVLSFYHDPSSFRGRKQAQDMPKPPYVGSKFSPELSSEHQIPDSEGIACMRAACQLAALVLDFGGKSVRAFTWFYNDMVSTSSNTTSRWSTKPCDCGLGEQIPTKVGSNAKFPGRYY